MDHILKFKNFCSFSLGEVSWFCRHYCGFASRLGVLMVVVGFCKYEKLKFFRCEKCPILNIW
jgi:hypothetical protein